MIKSTKAINLGASKSVVFSRDGSLIATVARDISIWDVSQAARVLRSHPFSHPSYADFSPDLTALAVKNTAGHIVIISTESGATVVDFANRKDGEGANLLYSQCGGYIVDGSWDGHVSVRRADSGAREFIHTFPDELITSVHRTRDGCRWVIVHTPKATTDDQPSPPDYFSVWEWPFRSSAYSLVEMRVPFLNAAALSDSGEFIATVHGAPPSSLSVFEIGTGKCVGEVPVDCGGTGAALNWSSDGQHIGSVQKDRIEFYTFPELTRKHEVKMEYSSDVVFSPKNDFIALGSWKMGKLVPWAMLGNQTPL